MKKSYVILILGCFILVLSGLRLLWIEFVQDYDQVPIENGWLDLSDQSLSHNQVLLLNGEWEFYPFEWIAEHTEHSLDDFEPMLIQVPGGWNKALNPDHPTANGYGSYRLRIQVNPHEKVNYSIRTSSIRSASEIYVNGLLLAQSGQVAMSAEHYTAKNLPYMATFTADQNGMIDIVIQTANYTDSRNSGIVRSIKFGRESAIVKEMNTSVIMQFMSAFIFFMHAIYAFILFLLGNRDKKLLYFALLTLCLALANILSNDEKLFHQLFYIGHIWDFRLANLTLLIGIFSTLQCTEHRQLRYWDKIYPYYFVTFMLIVGLTAIASPAQIISLFPIYYAFGCVTIIIIVIAVYSKEIKERSSLLLLQCAIFAIIHHFVWTISLREIGISTIHYPFDYIIAMGCYVSVWFKDYFKMHADTKKLAATLQRMNEHKDRFLANTAHEFKNPLHGILNFSQSVLNREQHILQERSKKELKTIVSVGQRLDLLLNDLIDVMSLQEGKPRLQKKAISIHPIIHGVLDLLQFDIRVKTVNVEYGIPDDFPLVIADEHRLIQIIFNLLHNAIKFTNEGTISIHAYTDEQHAYIIIKDTGIGMEKEMLDLIFQPYEQAEPGQTMRDGGFGLGLSISKQLVELHGGTLKASSLLGKGSEFVFSLPCADADKNEQYNAVDQTSLLHEMLKDVNQPENPIIQSIGQQTASIHNNQNNPSILIVDDDPVNLQALESILSSDEYNVRLATSGMEALQLIEPNKWDLVISDIMMPRMSGYELTRKIRERFSRTELPILLLTARNQPEDIHNGFLVGANDYVTKPVEAIEIRSRIEALIAIKQLIQDQIQLESAWLQAQIQPHFLFNTLNAIIALSNFDLDKMRSLLDEFTNYLQYKFNYFQMNEWVPIQEELNLVRSYLYIESVRFGDRLRVEWEIHPCDHVRVPFLSIQPLVENAVNHGIMKRVQGGTIVIRVNVNDSYTEIVVEDDGIGMDTTNIEKMKKEKNFQNSGVGLINTNLRLKRFLGTGLHIESVKDKGTKVSFFVEHHNSA